MSRLLWFVLLFSLITVDQTDGWRRRRRRRRCSRVNCAVTWGSWSSCPRSCGGGIKYRLGTVTRQPACGGSPCPALRQFLSCNSQSCPVDGGWSNWSGWNSCNMPCDTGSQQRSRSCTNPPPLYGGKSCSGTEREERSCNQHSCPVDGGWSNWGAWTTCSKPCESGTQVQRRTCSQPSPQYGGKQCPGEGRLERVCNTHSCPGNGLTKNSKRQNPPKPFSASLMLSIGLGLGFDLGRAGILFLSFSFRRKRMFFITWTRNGILMINRSLSFPFAS